jgi:hypothetical protein
MTDASANDLPARHPERAFVSDLFHAVSQPLTALECGLELSLRRDKSAAEFRTRVETALVNAKLLHRRLLEARALQDATEPGDTSLPIAVKGLLLQLQEDLLPVAKSARVKLDVKCETAMVRGNETRLRNGFFYLLEFLLRTCPTNHRVSLRAQRVSLSAFEVSFKHCASARIETPDSTPAADPSDLSLRIAQRTFQAAGGGLVLAENQSRQVAGSVHLLLAN